MRSALSVFLPPQQFTTACFPVLELEKTNALNRFPVKKPHSHQITCSSVEPSGSFFQTEPWLRSARKYTSDPKCVTVPAWHEVGHFVECLREVEGCPEWDSVRPIRKAEGGVSQTTLRFFGETLPPSTWRNNLRNYQREKNKREKLKAFRQSYSVHWKT